MSAETIARGLGGRKAGNCWTARCPAHDDRTPSLSIADASGGKVLIHCHTGCSQEQVILALRSRGLWTENVARSLVHFTPRVAEKKASADPDDGKRSDAALAIWQTAKPAQATPVGTYLASRGIELPQSDALRFHPGLRHPAGQTWPAMIALVRRTTDGVPMAIHRTFLASDGRAKAPVNSQKMMLGPCGDGAVQLENPDGNALIIGEGIETVLSAMQLYHMPGWAALSAGALERLPVTSLPNEVLIAADDDRTGISAAMGLASRLKSSGRSVRVIRPANGLNDFNDVLMMEPKNG